MIVRQGNKWLVKSSDGSKTLGEYDTRKEAVTRLAQIEHFKHADGVPKHEA